MLAPWKARWEGQRSVDTSETNQAASALKKGVLLGGNASRSGSDPTNAANGHRSPVSTHRRSRLACHHIVLPSSEFQGSLQTYL